MDDGRKFGGNLRAVGRALFGDFIADAPEDDGGVIAVALKHGAEILLVPIGKEEVVVVLRFPRCPAIEGLVHHDDAQAVADVEQFRRRRVVAGANGVAPHFLEDSDLPLQGAGVDGRAQRAQVVVVAHALQSNSLPVEEKTVVGSKLNRADAKWSFTGVNGLAALLHGRDGDVAIGLLQAPELGIGDGTAQGDFAAGMGAKLELGWGADERRSAGLLPPGVELEDLRRTLRLGVSRGSVLHFDPQIDRRSLPSHFRGDVSAPVADMDGRGLDQPNVAIDAASGIPA